MHSAVNFSLVIYLMIAGAIGTLCRFFATRVLSHIFSNSAFPIATFSVNILGAFVAGLLFAFFKDNLPSESAVPVVCLIGFLGAFTTFSTFALECANAVASGAWGVCIAFCVTQNVVGILAALAGIWIVRG